MERSDNPQQPKCQHDERFLDWEDHSKPIVCMKCEVDRLRVERDEAGNALTKCGTEIERLSLALATCRRLLREDRVCAWTGYSDDRDTWNTGCGEVSQFMDGGPVENGVAFCPFCGGRISTEAAQAAGCEG